MPAKQEADNIYFNVLTTNLMIASLTSLLKNDHSIDIKYYTIHFEFTDMVIDRNKKPTTTFRTIPESNINKYTPALKQGFFNVNYPKHLP